MTQPQRSSAEQAQAAQAGLAVMLARDLARSWGVLDVTRMKVTLPQFSALVAAQINRYGAGAATLAANFYRTQRVSAGITGRFTVIPAPLPDLERVASMTRWATATLWQPEAPIEPAKTLLEGATQNLVADVARTTVIDNAKRDRKARGWARVPEPTACSFCMLLATRGAVYKEQTVDFRAHQPRLNKTGKQVGGVCQCHAEPVFTAYEPTAAIRAAQGLYAQVKHDSPAAMRQEFRRLYEASQK